MRAGETHPEELADRHLERFDKYWRELPKNDGVVSRKYIDLADCRVFAPHLIIVEVMGPESDFRVRLAGTEVVDCFGLDFVGRRMSEIDISSEVERLIEDCAFAVENRVPKLRSGIVFADGAEKVGYRRILCPIAGKGGAIEMLIGVQVSMASPQRWNGLSF
jgi:hypothetical protein